MSRRLLVLLLAVPVLLAPAVARSYWVDTKFRSEGVRCTVLGKHRIGCGLMDTGRTYVLDVHRSGGVTKVRGLVYTFPRPEHRLRVWEMWLWPRFRVACYHTPDGILCETMNNEWGFLIDAEHHKIISPAARYPS